MGIELSRNTRRSGSKDVTRPHLLTSILFSRNTKHVEWVRAFIGLLEELRKYIVEHHTTGLSWNPKVLHIFYP